MGATFMDETGKPQPLVMGCYGIGVSRVVAAAVEQYADDKGIVWPVPLAPFEAVVAVLKAKDSDMVAAGETIYEELKAVGIDTMFDERKLSPGAKMKDLELLGFPYVVIVGRDFASEGLVELRNRRSGEVEKVASSAVAAKLLSRLVDERKGL
jgi:prolyl-tRNA synthetase